METSQEQERNLFENIIAALEAQFANAGAHLTVDSVTRQAYSKQVKAMANQLRQDALRGKVSWADAAKQANEVRNTIIDMFRWRSTPVGRAYAESLKRQGKTLNEMIAKKSQDLYGKNVDFNKLIQQQKNAVYGAIVKSAGKSDPKTSSQMKKLGVAGRGLIVLSIAIVAYNIATADDKLTVAKKEAVVVAGGIGGGVIGGATAGLACGPGAPVCVTIGAFVGGILGAFGISVLW